MAMTTAINDSTTRLKALEDQSHTTRTFLDSLNTKFDAQHQAIAQQSNEIKQIHNAYHAQHQLVTALQQTQLQQGHTLEHMNAVQNSLSTKMDQLVALQRTTPDAENRMAAGPSNE